MNLEIIQTFCGKQPPDSDITNIAENTIFKVDPNFTPINLYDFWGNAATVNSYVECANYVNGGWRPLKTTFFDILEIIGIGTLSAFLLFVVFKYRKNIKIHFKTVIKKVKILPSRINSRHLIVTIFPIQAFFVFDYIRTKSVRLPSFIDEYITLTSNVGFFKTLNYNAGSEFGGNYSVQLTSGPISDIGGVIGWILSDSIYISRVSNFLWIYFLQLIFIYILKKVYFKKIDFLFLVNGLFIFLIPWWIGALYGIGEIASMVVFTNAIYLFHKNRNFSIILFAISIFFGKYLTLVGFVGFYLSQILREKNIRKINNDFFYFLIPVVTWLAIVNFKYENGNAFDYIRDQINFIFGHQSSGLKESDTSLVDGFVSSISVSEFINWNDYEKIRVLIIPIIFMLFILKNRERINNLFGYIALPLFYSILLPYCWFWIINPTKWIRLSQHFTVVIIISLIYFINFELFESRFNLALLAILLIQFIDNNKSFIPIFVVVILIALYFKKDNLSYQKIKFLIFVIILIDIMIPYFEKTTFGNLSPVIEECQTVLLSSDCKNAYMTNN